MAEVEERFNRIEKNESVEHVLIVDEDGKIIKRSKADEKEQKKIATTISKLAKKAKSVVRDINPNNDLSFFRVRSKNKEILVAPDKNLFLIVIQIAVEREKEGQY